MCPNGPDIHTKIPHSKSGETEFKHIHECGPKRSPLSSLPTPQGHQDMPAVLSHSPVSLAWPLLLAPPWLIDAREPISHMCVTSTNTPCPPAGHLHISDPQPGAWDCGQALRAPKRRSEAGSVHSAVTLRRQVECVSSSSQELSGKARA